VTVAEGEVSPLHIGLTGTMNALFLKNLADKTHRGLRGRVAAGKSAGGLSYGYRVMRDNRMGTNEPERGDRRIDQIEAAIVTRIFREFASGMSPVAIARQLNTEGTPGPGGRAWQDTTIRGHAVRATGVLRNELYIGRLVWNRMHFIKDPASGKRVSRMNPAEKWVFEDVPQLRIIEQELWDDVKLRLAGIREKMGANKPGRIRFWEARRPKHLLTDKMHCAICGGALRTLGRDYMACGAARKRGTCSNTSSIRRSELNALVIDALRTNLMHPDDVREFVGAFTVEWNRLVAETSADRAHDQSKLTTVQRKIDRIVSAIVDGYRIPEMKDQLDLLNGQKNMLQTRLKAPQTAPPSLHPNLAEVYRSKVAGLQEQLAANDGNNAAVLERLRDLIDRVEFGPRVIGGVPEITLTGALASMVQLGLGQKPSVSGGGEDLFSCSVKVVAGVGFEPTTFRL
jgi:site-specific DNA recombinase